MKAGQRKRVWTAEQKKELVTANTICSPTRLFTKRFPLPDSIREYVLRLSGDPKVCNWQLSLPESVHTEAVFF